MIFWWCLCIKDLNSCTSTTHHACMRERGETCMFDSRKKARLCMFLSRISTLLLIIAWLQAIFGEGGNKRYCKSALTWEIKDWSCDDVIREKWLLAIVLLICSWILLLHYFFLAAISPPLRLLVALSVDPVVAIAEASEAGIFVSEIRYLVLHVVLITTVHNFLVVTVI